MPEPMRDKPRKIVVCSRDDYQMVHLAVAGLGHGDVLVQPSDLVEAGTSYVMDPPTEVIA